MKIEKTERGLELVKFVDSYGAPCSLQQSSAAIYEQPGSGAIWLGNDDGERMHLHRDQVLELLPLLASWCATGSFATVPALAEKLNRAIQEEDAK